MQRYTSPFLLERWATICENIVFMRELTGDFTADTPAGPHYRQMMQANIPGGAPLRDRTARPSKGQRKNGQLQIESGSAPRLNHGCNTAAMKRLPAGANGNVSGEKHSIPVRQVAAECSGGPPRGLCTHAWRCRQVVPRGGCVAGARPRSRARSRSRSRWFSRPSAVGAAQKSVTVHNRGSCPP